jgi:hypothetical protein
MDLDHILPDHEGPGIDAIAPPACHLLGSVDLVDRKEEVDIEGCSRARVDRERETTADGEVNARPLECAHKSAKLIDEVQHDATSIAPRAMRDLILERDTEHKCLALIDRKPIKLRVLRCLSPGSQGARSLRQGAEIRLINS